MADAGKLSGWLLRFARRVLYVWVRTAVFPARLEELALDPAKPVCYVLQDRHLSSLLVLGEETRRAALPRAEAPIIAGRERLPRSFFFLNRDRRRHAGKGASSHSPLLIRLIAHALDDAQFDVQLVPVVILWGRSPDKQESILKALFSETWRRPGPWRQLLAILLHGRNVLVRFNAPISLRGFLAEGLDQEAALRKLSRVLRVHFRRQRQMAIGPDLSHRHTQVNAVLAGERVRAAMADEAALHGIPLAEAQSRARGFALEIASDYSYGVVRALELFLTWLWTRLYDGIELHNFATVTHIAPGHEIVYVPCHRSHIDYLLLSYIIHRQGLTPPHIAAGANLNLPIVGSLLRRGGAFFLRRSLKGEALYAAVFHEYLHLMLARGFSIEYFIEGGRSRSGRMLTPKAGILGMTVLSFIRQHARALVFVPVYVGYEKIIEGKAYLGELAGQPKQRESLLGLLRSVRELKRVFGKVHVNFGQPLALADFLDARRADWRTQAVDEQAAWARSITRSAAAELARRINDAAVLNPVNLIALALLATPRHTADEHGLLRLLEHYRGLVSAAPYAPTTISCPLNGAQIVDYAERLALVERLSDPFGPLIRVREGQAPLLAYFRNNVLHLFALPAVIACLLSHNRRLDTQRVIQAVAGICTLMRAELFLRWTDDELPAASEAIVGVLLARGLLRRSQVSGRLAAADPISQESAELRLLGETIRPLLERHFLTLALLERHGPGKLSRQALEDQCHLLARRLSLLDQFNAADFPEKATFSAFITNLVEAEFLREDEGGMLHFDERLLTPLAHSELVLSADARQAIRRMAGADVTGG
ncbi:glycerol-3-phosphate 1-O-acyltransferase PlsB [Accumulibacter sp.]|uniref:glycerol-3-phosphate 1-O-acyltransferase PlsB n=1 Tax=Accumulibacter sp. TaxID=2053492 RepID=UPI00287ABA2C|nr:glycerol-3-phosphate 1-O-acyltransferase PlsB [Accumulibacter sp.]MDS4054376.1 glycerol-3-phosphate 1-O-acyltransferase PlsB [Accumulibacter sp.]HMW64537.1 glycerol-3-phosphate 1-O-acyltransferase PlsB [Accumulibacter sp.]HNC28033.1 glycerol-3-phosphate 1-O-acyltransferase PlsB [Accumulibacter sp.]HNG14778.1 glycerol-3-phosphate 1-O-acyltransferase PlsB [Accumulibacter sp.]HNH91482.1 glycerol-3-phosphate 1-O-acyltransferase PlsB [Accumulibacter sp.]